MILYGKGYPDKEFTCAFIEHGYGGLYHTVSSDTDYDLVGKVTNGVVEFNELNKYTQSGWLRSIRKEDWKLNMDMYGKGEMYHIK